MIGEPFFWARVQNCETGEVRTVGLRARHWRAAMDLAMGWANRELIWRHVRCISAWIEVEEDTA